MAHIGYRPHSKNKQGKKLHTHALDGLIYPIALITPIMTVPQLFIVLGHNGAQGVSLPTWSAYALAAGLWTIYGLSHREYPIILANFLLFVLDTSIVTHVLLYK